MDINKQDEDLKKRKLFVKGLPLSCTNEKLMSVFSMFGEIDKAYILYDHKTGLSRGFGFVEYLCEADVHKAIVTQVMIDGKVIKSSPAVLKQESKNSQGLEIKKTKQPRANFQNQSESIQAPTKPLTGNKIMNTFTGDYCASKYYYNDFQAEHDCTLVKSNKESNDIVSKDNSQNSMQETTCTYLDDASMHRDTNQLLNPYLFSQYAADDGYVSYSYLPQWCGLYCRARFNSYDSCKSYQHSLKKTGHTPLNSCQEYAQSLRRSLFPQDNQSLYRMF